MKVDCDQSVVASERAIYGSTLNEVMGTTEGELSAQWWFSWYD